MEWIFIFNHPPASERSSSSCEAWYFLHGWVWLRHLTWMIILMKGFKWQNVGWKLPNCLKQLFLNSWTLRYAVLYLFCWTCSGNRTVNESVLSVHSIEVCFCQVCLVRTKILNFSHSLPKQEKSSFDLAVLSSGQDVVIVKSGRRICGTGAALGNAPIVQNKAYFEVKIQSTGLHHK